MAKKKTSTGELGTPIRRQSTGELDSVIGQGPDKAYQDFQKQRQARLAAQVVQQKAQQANEPKPKPKKSLAQNIATFGKTVATGARDAVTGVVKTAYDVATIAPREAQVFKAKYGTPDDAKAQATRKENNKAIKKSVDEAKDFARFLPRAAVQVGESVPIGHASERNVHVSDKAPGALKALLGKEEIPSLQHTYKEVKKDKGSAAAAGQTLVTGIGDLLALKGGHEAFVKGGAKADAVKAGIGKDKATNDLVTNTKVQQATQGANGRMSLGKTAVDDQVQPLVQEKTKLQSLKAQNPAHSQVLDETIKKVDDKIGEITTNATKEAETTQKATEKSSADIQKIDQQTALIKAKQKDTGKTSEVDKVKLQQLSDRKQEIQASAEPVAPETPTQSTPSASVEKPATPVASATPEIKPAIQVADTQAAEVSKNPSKVARSIEAKAVEKHLTNSFDGVAGYDPITVKEQAQISTDLVKNDPQKARNMINGSEPLPNNLRGAALIKAVEEHALKTKDTNLLRELANSPLAAETSKHAQELRLLAERDPDSAVAKIKEVVKARTKAAEGRLKESIPKAVTRTTKEIKQSVKSPTRMEWSQFVESIKCR